MWPRTDLIDLLKIAHPIVQAPMAGSATIELVAAVSNAGGLGSLGCGEMNPKNLIENVSAIRKLTDKPFNLNFMAYPSPIFNKDIDDEIKNRISPFYEALEISEIPTSEISPFAEFNQDILESLLELQPQIVSFHFGLPEIEMVNALKNIGTLILCSATTVSEAKILNESGVHAIISQGWEAGGHRGSFEVGYEDCGIGNMALVPQIVDSVDVPVIATGGIADGRGIAAAFALGASGVQMGSAFLSCPEAGTSEVAREVLRNAKDDDTRLTRAYSGRPARARKNSYSEEMAKTRSPIPDYPTMYNLSMPIHRNDDSHKLKFILYGQAAALNRELPAPELVQLLVNEAREIFS